MCGTAPFQVVVSTTTLWHTDAVITGWRNHYNTIRPHSSLG